MLDFGYFHYAVIQEATPVSEAIVAALVITEHDAETFIRTLECGKPGQYVMMPVETVEAHLHRMSLPH